MEFDVCKLQEEKENYFSCQRVRSILLKFPVPYNIDLVDSKTTTKTSLHACDPLNCTINNIKAEILTSTIQLNNQLFSSGVLGSVPDPCL
jgi:hypothetical protein